jgi:hypothetical protein
MIVNIDGDYQTTKASENSFRIFIDYIQGLITFPSSNLLFLPEDDSNLDEKIKDCLSLGSSVVVATAKGSHYFIEAPNNIKDKQPFEQLKLQECDSQNIIVSQNNQKLSR